MLLYQRVALIRALANGYAHAPLPHALARIHALVPAAAPVRDAFGTNSHFSLSLLEAIDALVGALAALATSSRR